MIDMITLWFKRAMPTPTPKNFNTQVGCHFEEVVEMLNTLRSGDTVTYALLSKATDSLHVLSEALKKGGAKVDINDRKEFLDSLADQIVTATGCGYIANVNVAEATKRVNASNWSKYDEFGQPIFDANGKIAKNPATYKKVDLDGLY